jgi:integrative and conjugative element protein (TIGR02256 family)
LTVLLGVHAREALESEACRRRMRETGGALFGFEQPELIMVACAYGPGPHARHRRASFEPHRQTTEAVMTAVRDASQQRYRFLGSWHTHPGGVAVPSGRDTATAEEVAADPAVRLALPLVIIQATRPRARGATLAELAAWRWDPSLHGLRRLEVETVELEERWCPIVPLDGRWRHGRVRG